MKITVVGLGPGPYALLTQEAVRVLEQSSKVWLRTSRHPTIEQLPANIQWESLDYVYDRAETFDGIYHDIAAEVISIASREGEMVYAVPGDPTIAEDSVRELMAMAPAQGIELRIVSGVSFIEAALAAAGTTLTGGLQLLDPSQISRANPLLDLLVYQIENRFVASDVKVELLRLYADDHPVILLHAASAPELQRVEEVHLHDLDRGTAVDHLSALFVPAATPETSVGSMESLVRIVAHLRAPDGCPWDKEQTHESLKPYVIEEAYEVVDAIDSGNPAVLSEELGDLLLQVLLHAEIGKEQDSFDLTDVVAHIAAKLIRRHPHVFGDVSVSGSQQVLVNWEALKKKERENGEHMFSGVPSSLPAMQAAQRIQERAAHVGFDWKDTQGPLEKVAEEARELAGITNRQEQVDEFGDLMFALVNAARHLGIDAEMALRAANRKFVERFLRMDEMAKSDGVEFSSLALEEQDQLWNKVKVEEQERG